MQVRCTFEVAQLCLIATAKSTCTERKDPKNWLRKVREEKPFRILEGLQGGPNLEAKRLLLVSFFFSSLAYHFQLSDQNNMDQL